MSGPEKSRHFRHEVVGLFAGIDCTNDAAGNFGFVAIILDRSGRDDVGMGGGFGLGVLPFVCPFVWGDGSDLVGIGGGSFGGRILPGSLD